LIGSRQVVGANDLAAGARVLACIGALGASLRGSSLCKRWHVAFFAFLYRNVAKTIDRFILPSRQVIEIAREIEL
jgi:K+ transporter